MEPRPSALPLFRRGRPAIRLPGSACLPYRHILSSRKSEKRTPHSTQRKGRTPQADKIVRSTSARLLDLRVRRPDTTDIACHHTAPPSRYADTRATQALRLATGSVRG
jgi:hypothetical protein